MQLSLFESSNQPKGEPRPMTGNNHLASKLRESAEKLEPFIDNLRRPLTQNGTPKRIREYNSRVHEGNNWERAKNAMIALAHAHEAGTCPSALLGLRHKNEIFALVRCKLDTSGGYYCANPTDDPWDTGPIAHALRLLVQKNGNGEDPAAKLRFEIDKLENELRFVDIPGFFPTPKELGIRLVELADIQSDCGEYDATTKGFGGMKILEPSAGKGDLAEVIREKHPDAQIQVLEWIPKMRDLLLLKGFNVLADEDFLKFNGGHYDRIVMNPPFEKGADIEHVFHAYELLVPGGKLVSIVSNGSFSGESQKRRDFRRFIELRDAEVHDVEPGAFSGAKAFRQTGASVKIVVIDKPE